MVFLLTSLFLSLLIFGFLSVARYYYEDSLSRVENEIENIENYILIRSENLKKVMQNIVYNPVTQNYLKEKDLVKQFHFFKDMDNIITKIKEISPGIREVILINNQGKSYNITLSNKKNIDQFLLNYTDDSKIIYSSQIKYKSDLNFDNALFAGLKIYNLNNNSRNLEILGKIVVVLDPNLFFNINNFSDNIFLVDRDNNILSRENNESYNWDNKKIKDPVFSPMLLLNKEEQIVTTLLEDWGINIIGKVKYENIFYKFLGNIKNSFFIISGIIVIFFIINVSITRNIVETHRGIESYLKSLNISSFKTPINRMEINGYREAKIISNTFNEMWDKNVKLSKDLLDLKLYTKEAEINYLINQINPHFLYNTLETIKGIAASKGVPEIQDITYSLGNMFRYSLKSETIVNLKDEIDLIEDYLKIQDLRFSNRFRYRILSRVDEDLFVPKMILQPIVENSIQHGLEGKYSDGKLEIDIDKHTNYFVISIKDNGLGIEENRLREINEKLKKGINESRHIGLINVHNRVKKIFGNSFGVEVESELGKGTTVSIKIGINGENCV